MSVTAELLGRNLLTSREPRAAEAPAGSQHGAARAVRNELWVGAPCVDHICHKVGGNGLSALENPQVIKIPPLYPCRVFITLSPST